MTTLSSALEGLLLFAAATALVLWVGRRRGFFAPVQPRAAHPPGFFLFLGAFLVYFAVQLSFSYWGTYLVPARSSIERASWIIFISQGLTAIALLGYFRWMPALIRRDLWLKRGTVNVKSDLFLAVSAWILSFPTVLFCTTLLEIIAYLITHTFEFPEQIAILFLKMTFGHPLPFILALASIVLFAPLIEEFLFRGLLQTYCRRYLSARVSILISSFCFAMFHFSMTQGWANLPLLGSLFVLACFLGYLYERQGSLLSSILFHSLFNTINVANLYFLGIE